MPALWLWLAQLRRSHISLHLQELAGIHSNHSGGPGAHVDGLSVLLLALTVWTDHVIQTVSVQQCQQLDCMGIRYRTHNFHTVEICAIHCAVQHWDYL